MIGPMTLDLLDAYREESANAKKALDDFRAGMCHPWCVSTLTPEQAAHLSDLHVRKASAQRAAEQAVLIWIAQDCKEV